MNKEIDDELGRYAELLVRVGVNLQTDQCLRIGAELEHCDMVRAVTEAAYAAGAKYVHIDWSDSPVTKCRYERSRPDFLDYVPEYEVLRHRQMVDEGWARLSLVGDAFPDLFEDVDPGAMRRAAVARSRALKFYMQALMANNAQWCVAAVPTEAWAAKVFPDQNTDDAIKRLWREILNIVRVDQADAVDAWQRHDETLKGVVAYLDTEGVQGVHFVDRQTGPDGRARTDLFVGLTDRPRWVGASAETPKGVRFMPNMPTEEVFSTPHRFRVDGWMHTSKPGFPMGREVGGMFVRFEQGAVVDYRAESGQDVLEQFFEIDGARYLGEVALVDVRSPVNRSKRVFYETLFDENAACHIAFGEAYPEGIAGAGELSEDELAELGMNVADTHLDVMIGTETMDVTGVRADGSRVPVMENGRFVDAAVGGRTGQ